MSEQSKVMHRGQIVASLILGAFVALLAQTLLNVALPHMMLDLNVSTNTIQWLANGYLLTNGILIPLSAFLVERFSTRKLFLSAVGLFAIGTIVCAVAPHFNILLTGRIIQAIGAGILMPLMMVVFLTIFPVEERGKAMGMMGLAMIFAPAIGPTLSGWVIEHYTWRVLFYIVLPLSIISFIFGFFSMKNVTETGKPKLDLFGVILSTLGFGGLLYGFSDAGNDGWGSKAVIATLVIGGIALIGFVWREIVVDKPILDMRVFQFSMFSLTSFINAIITMALYSGMILLPIYLQTLRGFTPLESGLLLLPGAILMGIMSPITGIIFDKVGARWLAVVGLLITVLTTFEFSRLTLETTYFHIILMYTARMFGMSMLMMPIQTAGINQLPRRLNSHGSAMSQTIRNVAGALGTALLVTVMTQQARARGADLVRAAKIDPSDAANAAQMQDITSLATVHGINYSFEVATWMTVAALILAFFIRRVAPADEARIESANRSSRDRNQPAFSK
ncbi:DHA2 family efflux MFS transporter permease subunit [Paenibacillus sp. HB172176]|uniref:DHA2 family efflux MFS transporter permease subunit n=1 Tax=Paenibacillus sp. HB172176 TaxID=2493690 RepID=UPI0014388766|nr:DHA2 family efflux MFS transporter permease subunit [Paenibacillus sp. HB172176]